MDSSLRKKIHNKFLNYIASKNKITSYEQIREAFLNLRNKALGFIIKNKEKIEFLFDYLNKKRNEEKKESKQNSETYIRVSYFFHSL